MGVEVRAFRGRIKEAKEIFMKVSGYLKAAESTEVSGYLTERLRKQLDRGVRLSDRKAAEATEVSSENLSDWVFVSDVMNVCLTFD